MALELLPRDQRFQKTTPSFEFLEFIDTHARFRADSDGIHDLGVEVEQYSRIQQAFSHGLLVRSEPKIEERPGREVAPGQGTHGWASGHVFFFSLENDLVIGLELVEHANPFSKDRSSVLDGDVDRVERVERLTSVQADCLTLLQCLDRLIDHGCGLPKLGDQLPVLREPLQELVADVVHRRSFQVLVSKSGRMAFPRIQILPKIVFSRSSFNAKGTKP
jgi:hypothetical protein